MQHGDAVGGERGAEGIGAEGVGVVVVGAAVEVGHADAGLDHVAAAGPGDHVVEAEVVFGAERVVLRRAAGEVAGDGDARSFGSVGVAAGVVLADEGELVEEDGGERGVDVRPSSRLRGIALL